MGDRHGRHASEGGEDEAVIEDRSIGRSQHMPTQKDVLQQSTHLAFAFAAVVHSLQPNRRSFVIFGIDPSHVFLTVVTMFQRALTNALVLLIANLGAFGFVSASSAAEKGVKITQMPEKLRVEINGELFTEYIFQGAPHVYLYPVIGPGGVPMTRNAPMKKVEGEDQDHPHHRSLWYSHGEANGIDFWAESAKSGKIVHDKFLEVKSGEDMGVIRAQNNWVAPDGAVTCVEEQTIRIYNRPKNERLFDFEVTLKAGDKDVVLGDTKEGSMGMRLAETMRLTRNKTNAGKSNGHIVLDPGGSDAEPGLAELLADSEGRQQDVGKSRRVVRLLRPRRGEDRWRRDLRSSHEPAPSHDLARAPVRPVCRQSIRAS